MSLTSGGILRQWAERCAENGRRSLTHVTTDDPYSDATGEALVALSRVLSQHEWGFTCGRDAVAACELAEEVGP